MFKSRTAANRLVFAGPGMLLLKLLIAIVGMLPRPLDAFYPLEVTRLGRLQRGPCSAT
jgi:hypothetical protein